MRVAITAFAVLTFLGIADAQSYGPPTYSVGDTWTVQQGTTTRKITVVALDGDGYVIEGAFKECPPCRVFTDRNLTWLKMLDERGNPPMGRYRAAALGPEFKLWDFPLEVKKKWQVSGKPHETGQGELTIDSIVEAYEEVKPPAGTFKAYKIRREWTFRGRQKGYVRAWSTLSWFAPDVKWTVKFTTTGWRGDDFELVSYSLK